MMDEGPIATNPRWEQGSHAMVSDWTDPLFYIVFETYEGNRRETGFMWGCNTVYISLGLQCVQLNNELQEMYSHHCLNIHIAEGL